MNNVTRGIRTSFLGSVGPNFCRTIVGQNGTRNWNPRLESRLGGFSGPNVLSFLDRNLQRNSYQRTTFSLGAKTTTSLTTEGKKMSFVQTSINVTKYIPLLSYSYKMLHSNESRINMCTQSIIRMCKV